MLESLGQFSAAANRNELEKKAVNVCVEQGVPRDVFHSKAQFDAHVDKLRVLYGKYMKASSACVNLAPIPRVKCGKLLYEKYRKELGEVGDQDILDLTQVGNYFAMHTAELTMARVVLAIAASRAEGEFPANLEEVAARFAGHLPSSPYDGSPLKYQVLNNGQDVSLTVPAVTVSGIKIPQVEFSSADTQ